MKAVLLRRFAARSATESASGAPELSTTTAAATAESLTTASRAASAPAPVSSTSLTLVLSSASTTAAVVLNLVETVVARCRSSWYRGGFGGIIGPALSAVNGSHSVGGFGLGRVPGNHLERLRERFILPSRLLVPLFRRCSVGSLGLDARCRWCDRFLVVYVANSCRFSIKLGKSCMRNSRVGNALKSFVLRGDSLRLRDVVYPRFLRGERSLLERRLLDLRVCTPISFMKT
jgi:hypothetical protein